MNREELKADLKQRMAYASINQRYHQKMIARYSKYDQLMKMTLGAVTCLSFTASMLGFVPRIAFEATVASAAFGLLSLVAAVSLTYLGFDAIERGHSDAFARWTYLFQDLATTYARLTTASDDQVSHLAERLPELTAKISEIEKGERPPDDNVLQQSQEDENEMHWGAGIRSHQDVLAEQARRAAQPTQVSTNELNPAATSA